MSGPAPGGRTTGGDRPFLDHPRLALLQFVALLAFWVALSWRRDPVYFAIGVVSAALITLVSQRLTATYVHGDRPSPRASHLPVLAWRFVAYGVWLVGRIVVAGGQIARIILSPSLPIDPVELRFRTDLKSPLARTVLANSITLVPGTLTVDLDGDELLVHALVPGAADDLITGVLQNRVAALFDEPPQPPVEPTWVPLGGATPGAPDPTDSTLGPHPTPAAPAHPDDWDGEEQTGNGGAGNGDAGGDGPDTRRGGASS